MVEKSTPFSYQKGVKQGRVNSAFFAQKAASSSKGVMVFEKEPKVKYFECPDSESADQTSGGGAGEATQAPKKVLKIGWFIDERDTTGDSALTFKGAEGVYGKFGLCQCPGKKLAMGRDGKSYDRNIFEDVEQFRSSQGITLIVCLLNDSELRHLGVQAKDYKSACEKSGVIFYQHPIIEMAPPDDLELFKKEVIDVIIGHLQSPSDSTSNNVLIHCRGGVGRAGLVACCLLATLCQFKSHTKIIEHVRRRRDKRCVESRK